MYSAISALPDNLKQAVENKDLPLAIAVKLTQMNDPFVNEKMIKVIERKKKYERDLLKNAIMAVNKSKEMKSKFRRLKKLNDSGIILSSVWDIGNRDNYAGDPDFYGNAPTQVVEQCILRLTEKKDLVLDPMSGSGTTLDVCKTFQRRCIAFDLNPKRHDIRPGNCTDMKLASKSIDLVFLHPPYWNMVKYSKEADDLSNKSLVDFYASIKKTIGESHRVLKENKYLCILIGDVVRDGQFIPLTRKIANLCEEIGFRDAGYAIKLTKDSVSQRKRGKAIYAELAKTRNLKINHDLTLFWKK